MSSITTHVLDTAHGKPASGIGVALEFESGGAWIPIGSGITGEDGRCRDLVPTGTNLHAGVYRLRFDTQNHSPFYPRVEIMFRVENASEHFHIPLLLSPFGYSTYRGS